MVPLFLGLGWSHQQIAVEWKKVDMAFFKQPPTTEQNCVMILEAKGMGEGLDDVLKQPIDYIKEKGLQNVHYIAVTNGQIILVYGQSGKVWNQTPQAYLDITCLKKKYIIPKGTNPVDTLVMLQPSKL